MTNKNSQHENYGAIFAKKEVDREAKAREALEYHYEHQHDDDLYQSASQSCHNPAKGVSK